MKCISDECEREALAKGCCDKHYRRLLKYGDMDYRKVKPKARMICEIDDCKKPVKGDGLCCSHYSRLRRYASPLGGSASRGHVLEWIRTILETKEEDCIKWPFCIMSNGYGQMTFKGRGQAAHRVVLALKTNEELGERLALHSCGKGHEGCVNPNHLRWGTPTDNTADMIRHGTRIKGTAVKSAKLNEAKVAEILGRIEAGEARSALAREYGIAPSTITKIAKREAWKHVEFNGEIT